MSTLFWNCRGLGNDATVRELRDLVKEFAPSILCVAETQIHKCRVENLASTLGYDNAFAVSSSGRSGGLGIYWNNEIKIDILPYSQYHIDAVVTPSGSDQWRLTCVYGEAQASERHKTWDMLKFIKASSPLPWLCIGDFNEVLLREEHVGVNDLCNAQIQAFRDAVDVCELMDLGFVGTPGHLKNELSGVLSAGFDLIVPLQIHAGAPDSRWPHFLTSRGWPRIIRRFFFDKNRRTFCLGLDCSGMKLCGRPMMIFGPPWNRPGCRHHAQPCRSSSVSSKPSLDLWMHGERKLLVTSERRRENLNLAWKLCEDNLIIWALRMRS
jgi:hypothetical protein